MNHRVIAALFVWSSLASAVPADAQRTAVPTEAAPRPSGPKVTTFTIANGSPTTADRDVTYQLAFDGSTALYRIGEGARSTGAWLITSRNNLSVPLQLVSGPEGTRTLYLEIRKDPGSASSIRTASIQLKYPSHHDVGGKGWVALKIADTSGFSRSRRKTNSTTGSILPPGHCAVSGSYDMGAGDPSISTALLTLGKGMSAETICEFKMFSGRTLKTGWTLKSAKVGLWARIGGAPIAGARCEITRAAWGTGNAELTILLRHPGSINPLDPVATWCDLEEVVFRGPDDPNITEGLAEALSASW